MVSWFFNGGNKIHIKMTTEGNLKVLVTMEAAVGLTEQVSYQ